MGGKQESEQARIMRKLTSDPLWRANALREFCLAISQGIHAVESLHPDDLRRVRAMTRVKVDAVAPRWKKLTKACSQVEKELRKQAKVNDGCKAKVKPRNVRRVR